MMTRNEKTNANRLETRQEIILTPKNGWAVLVLSIAAYLLSIATTILSAFWMEAEMYALGVPVMVISILYMCFGWFWWLGLKVLRPKEALVLTLFGKYIGSVKREGFYYVNPFCQAVNPAAEAGSPTVTRDAMNSTGTAGGMGVSVNGNSVAPVSRKVSLKAMTHDNQKQKINDELGNPIEVGIIVIWRVLDTARAVFNVDNYKVFLSTQADSALRDVVRCYPYDAPVSDDPSRETEPSLRGSSAEVAQQLQEELQKRVEFAGLEIMEARITHLAYAPEIAAAMLQRQQATAIIEARQKIVDGAVGMVEMALEKIDQGQLCQLDDERKAQMVSNLLVVLCGNRDAQPIVNTGSLY